MVITAESSIQYETPRAVVLYTPAQTANPAVRDMCWIPASLVFLCLGLALYCYLRGSTNFPPGPPRVPVLGNLLHFPHPSCHPWFKLTEWQKAFGDIVYVHGLGNSIVILNSMDCIVELLSKHGYLCAERPIFTMGELMGLDRSMPLMSCTKTWQQHRKLAHKAFSPEAVKKYHGVQEDIAALLSLAFIEKPEHFIDHVRLATGRIVMSVTYGISPQVAEHDYIAHAEDTMMMISDTMVPGAFLVDTIPALKHIPRHLPFRTFHDIAKENRSMIEKMVFPPFLQVQKEMMHGVHGPSLVSDLLSTPRDNDDSQEVAFEEAVKWTAGSMYGAGGETTYSTVVNFILAMVLYPEAQRRAHEELDKLLPGRLPSIGDRASTPYLNALLKETLRWHPSLPLGLPHRSSKKLTYSGYVIPRNTIAIPNIWAVSRTPDPDFPPEDFTPERFLERKSGSEVPDPSSYVFGFGRRICPGKSLAENSLYILIAYLVYCFSFELPRDANGNEQPIHPTWKTGLTSFPNPFKCTIRPRALNKVSLIQQRASL